MQKNIRTLEEMRKDEYIWVAGFNLYGDATMFNVKKGNMSAFLMGYTDEKYVLESKRPYNKMKIVPLEEIKNEDGSILVMLYNEYYEEFAKTKNYKEYMEIEDKNIKLYGKCMFCRMIGEDFIDINKDDYNKVIKYFH